MGVNISEIVPRKEIEIKDLKGKVIAIDALNTLYQFLTTIRQADGTPLMDKKGNITSHLSGLFYRNINLLQEGIKPIYVFDGKPPELKREELEKRKKQKKIAQEKYEKAKAEEDTYGMRKYSAQFVKVDNKIIEESKELLEAMGIPTIQSEGEGEAQAAQIVAHNLAWASASQDYDSLLYGTPRLIRNMTLSRKRKTGSGVYVETMMELVEFENLLAKLQINKDQLICLGILVGTDFNPGGVRGIGQKRALEIVQKNKFPIEIFNFVEKSDRYELDFDWQEIFKEFHKHNISKEEKIDFKKIDEEKITEILLKHDFSEDRIDSGLQKLRGIEDKKKQKSLTDFF